MNKLIFFALRKSRQYLINEDYLNCAFYSNEAISLEEKETAALTACPEIRKSKWTLTSNFCGPLRKPEL